MKKVTAKQLMIGDWVKWKGKYKRVDYLPKPVFDPISKIALEMDDNEYLSYIRSATPIPITEEWLKLNGWSELNYVETLYHKSDSKIISMFYRLKNGVITINNVENEDMIKYLLKIENIQYIHQLQQVYRLACNKELKVKF